MEEVTVRLARESEHADLVDLLRRSALSVETDREALLSNIEIVTFPISLIALQRVFVAELAGRRVGFAAVAAKEDGREFLEKLFVEPGFMKRGIGRLLAEHCLEFARGKGVRIISVVANPHAEGFYLACGFDTVDKLEMRLGTALIMERVL